MQPRNHFAPFKTLSCQNESCVFEMLKIPVPQRVLEQKKCGLKITNSFLYAKARVSFKSTTVSFGFFTVRDANQKPYSLHIQSEIRIVFLFALPHFEVFSVFKKCLVALCKNEFKSLAVNK